MRQLKFRAWDKEEKTMVMDYTEKIVFEAYGFCSPEKFEYLQYTGLKDKNGKEIYESDILFRMKPKMFQDSPTKPEYAIVEYTDDTFVGRYSDRKEGSGNIGIKSFLTVPTPFEIIGNIYENPELINRE